MTQKMLKKWLTLKNASRTGEVLTLDSDGRKKNHIHKEMNSVNTFHKSHQNRLNSLLLTKIPWIKGVKTIPDLRFTQRRGFKSNPGL
jgi:hypothetical protein